MMNLKTALTATGLLTGLTAATIALAVPAQADAAGNTRAQVASDYQNILVPTLNVPIEWTGSVDGCSPGDSSPAYQQATLTAVNYMRNLAGQPPVTLNTTLHAGAQDAALMFLANRSISHNPPADWACYSGAGAASAGQSNIYYSRSGPNAIVGYMQDPGPSNTLVGHRRWILNSRGAEIATGDTPNSNALTVFGMSTRPSNGNWIAWPTQGYFPWQLEPRGRWSLSKPGADFSQATVSVTLNGQNIPVTTAYSPLGYGDPSISWDMAIPNEIRGYQHPEDANATVTVNGIRINGQVTDYSYDVNLFDASPVSAPGLPSIENVTRQKGNKMLVTLAPQAGTGGDANITFTITATPQGSMRIPKPGPTLTCETKELTCQLNGANPRVNYMVKVAATNSAGTTEDINEYQSLKVK